MIYTGVVESRADPLKTGRYKVRVIGVHSENKSELPTSDLPWASAMQSVTSAAVSGIGESPTGLVEGSWVLIFFRDGESKQEPVILGSIAGVPETQDVEFNDKQKTVIPGASTTGIDEIVKGSGLSSTSSSSSSTTGSNRVGQTQTPGEQVLTQETSTTTGDRATGADSGAWKLGQTSKVYESGKGGPGTVSTGKGDLGGVSYGTHQFASFRDQTGSAKSSSANHSPVEQFVNNSKWKNDFAGMVPGTPAFTTKWKEVAARDPVAFEQAQYERYKGEYYNKGMNNVRASGIDLTQRGPAVKDAVWSTSVQYGVGGARKVFTRALNGKDVNAMTDAEIISAVQADKLKNVDIDFRSSSQSVKDSIKSRIKSEERDLLKLAGTYKSDEVAQVGKTDDDLSPSEPLPAPGEVTEDSTYIPPKVASPASGIRAPTLSDDDSKAGFQDPDGRYPRQKWIGEPDVSRIARNSKLAETIFSAKEDTLVKSVQSAGGFEWSEPASKYNAVYPLNHVSQTESGHVTEYDDTPGAERIHIYHRAGSFVEYHPDGTVVFKSVKDQFEVIVNHRNVYVGGDCNVTVAGNARMYVKGTMSCESDGDMTFKTKGNLKIGAEGTAKIESNAAMHVGSRVDTHIAGKNIFLNCTWGSANVNAGGYETGTISVKVNDDGQTPIPADIEAATIAQLQRDGLIPVTALASKKTAIPTETDSLLDTLPGDDASGIFDSGVFVPEETISKIVIRDDIISSELLPTTKLSNNVSLSDLTTSATYPAALISQAGLSVTDIAMNLSNVANNILEPIYAQIGTSNVEIESGFRRLDGFTRLANSPLVGTVIRESEYELRSISNPTSKNILEVVASVSNAYPANITRQVQLDIAAYIENKSIAVSSHHLGMAVDLSFPNLPLNSVAEFAHSLTQEVTFDQFILQWYGNKPVFHMSYNSERNRGDVMSRLNGSLDTFNGIRLQNGGRAF